MLDTVQKNEILNWVATACDIAEIDPPKIAFDLKGRVAGWYIPSTDTVRINTCIAERYFNEYKDIVLHELAHAVDYKRNGDRKDSRGRHIHHDDLFRSYILEMGGTNLSTTHNFEVKKTRKYRKFLYECGCDENHEVTTILHNKMQKKGFGYKCLNCGESFSGSHFLHEVK